ncbi:MAG: lipoyl synthase [Chloroflexi bacterium RBG_16_48_7]|nr:MAG: lipoyl synthase [Chloroflexi bacterium RBG_16_48_7]
MIQKLPVWFKQQIPRAGEIASVERLLKDLRLHTVCDGAHCPNKGFCFSRGTATFMIMGDTCTRNCTFCAISKGGPSQLDTNEPSHITEAVRRLALRYVVITSVTRDDLPDGGASHFARTIESLHRIVPQVKVEVLVPDFEGDPSSIKTVMQARPEVFSHNLETVPSLYHEVRPMADYRRSLEVLGQAKQINADAVTKSALMLGLGETHDEVVSVMQDLREVGCNLLTLGQYLAPPDHHPVIRFLPPAEFAEYEQIGLKVGFSAVASAPLVRSSFKAAELFDRAQERRRGQPEALAKE